MLQLKPVKYCFAETGVLDAFPSRPSGEALEAASEGSSDLYSKKPRRSNAQPSGEAESGAGGGSYLDICGCPSGRPPLSTADQLCSWRLRPIYAFPSTSLLL